jgi:hypothetical protein
LQLAQVVLKKVKLEDLGHQRQLPLHQIMKAHVLLLRQQQLLLKVPLQNQLSILVTNPEKIYKENAEVIVAVPSGQVETDLTSMYTGLRVIQSGDRNQSVVNGYGGGILPGSNEFITLIIPQIADATAIYEAEKGVDKGVVISGHLDETVKNVNGKEAFVLQVDSAVTYNAVPTSTSSSD